MPWRRPAGGSPVRYSDPWATELPPADERLPRPPFGNRLDSGGAAELTVSSLISSGGLLTSVAGSAVGALAELAPESGSLSIT